MKSIALLGLLHNLNLQEESRNKLLELRSLRDKLGPSRSPKSSKELQSDQKVTFGVPSNFSSGFFPFSPVLLCNLVRWRKLPDFWAEKKVQNPVTSVAVMVFGSRFSKEFQALTNREKQKPRNIKKFGGTPPLLDRNHPLSGRVLRDTARLSQRYPPIARYGVFGVSTWQIGCDTASPLSERFPLGEHAKWRCDTAPQKGYLAIPYENKANGCDTPLCDTISKGYCAIWGGISRWAPKNTTTVVKHYGRVSETPFFPGGKSTGSLHK